MASNCRTGANLWAATGRQIWVQNNGYILIGMLGHEISFLGRYWNFYYGVLILNWKNPYCAFQETFL